jgi:hypothetical protein
MKQKKSSPPQKPPNKQIKSPKYSIGRDEHTNKKETNKTSKFRINRILVSV